MPILGEVKSDVDTDFFYALVQALMYAVELSSDSQKDRLRDMYSDLPKSNFRFEVQVIFEEEIESAKKKKLFDESCAIAEGLMRGDSLGGFVQEISFVKATLSGNENQSVVFEKIESYFDSD